MSPNAIRNTLIACVVSLFLWAAFFAGVAMAAGIDNAGTIQRSYEIARGTWQPNHCFEGRVSLYSYRGSDSGNPAGVEDAIAYAYLGGCEVYFNVEQPLNFNRITFCSTMVHEFGHLARRQHNSDPRDIMNPYGDLKGPHWFTCVGGVTLQRRYLRRGHVLDYSTAFRGVTVPRAQLPRPVNRKRIAVQS